MKNLWPCIHVSFLRHPGVTDLNLPHIFVQFSFPLSHCPAEVSYITLLLSNYLKLQVFTVAFTVTQLNRAVLQFLNNLTQFPLLLCFCKLLVQPKYHPIAQWVAKANISCDLSATASLEWHWSEDVSKYTSVPEDIYTSTVTILKNDEQAPSADGNQKIHQNQSIFSRENIKGLTSWREALSIFSDQFLSLSHLLHLSPLLSSTAGGGHSHSLLSPTTCLQRNSSCAMLHTQAGFPELR